jgi:hypothetical protein
MYGENNNYSVPDIEGVEYMDTSEAQAKLKEFECACFSDKRHPYMTAGHPLHKDYIEYGLKLREKVAEGRENIFDKALRESREEQERKQEKLFAEAEKLFDEMDELGFEGRERVSLENIQPWQLDLWRMQLLNAKHDFKNLRPMIEQQIWNLKLSGAETFRSLIDDGNAPDDISAHIDLLLERIYKLQEDKHTLKKPKNKEGADNEEL